ncbi:putative RNA methyltransferase [Streptacidiphilus monticola]
MPLCGQELTEEPTRHGSSALRCPAGHSFDLARQGYVSLLAPGAHTGTADTAEMVAARADFLRAGHYVPIAELISSSVPLDARTLVDVGAGTGWYAAWVLDERPQLVGLALDISKFALRRAARAHPGLGAVVCDAWRPLPVRDGAADVLLNVFAPRNGPEMRRVLRPGGRLLVVSPTPRHLAELVVELGLLGVDSRKEERLAATLEPHLTAAGSEELEFSMELTHAEVRTVVGMGPSAWHTDPDALARRIEALPERMRVTGSVRLSAFERRDV